MVNAIPGYFKSQWSLAGNFTLTIFTALFILTLSRI